MKTIAIVGGGFSGTMAAVNIARMANEPLRVIIINHRHPLGRGVAYGTQRAEHVLNVAARNMSAFPDHPDHFFRWLRTRVDYSDLPDPQLREMFVPRRVFGDYLRSLLFNYMQPVDEHHPATIEAIENKAIDIKPVTGGAEIEFANGDTVRTDRILLATGNQQPATLPGVEKLAEHPGYCPNPWSNWCERLPASGEIVVLGTGLSMIDVFLTLEERKWEGRLVCISRNGKLPQSHFRGIDYPEFLPEEPQKVGLDGLKKLLEKHCQQLLRLGANPGIVVDRLRPHTQRIWQNFSIEEKQRFLNEFAAQWNVIRHRIAQPIHQRITEAITDGRVRVDRGRIEALAAVGDRISVTVRNDAGESKIESNLVINCTGPQSAFAGTEVPLFKSLLQRGLVRPDEMNMGIDVGPDFSVTNSDGKRSDLIYAIGPLMRGTLWETTAVPELRGQAKRVAEILASDEIAADRDLRMSEKEAHVVEYYI
ncbi:MAG: FAD/NAD(P)-binding protein [Limisphaerales bacterium]